MKKSILICLSLSLVLLFSSSFKTKEKAMFWGTNGHRITAQIGEWHLSKQAQKRLNDITEHSLAYLSTLPDDIKPDRSWSFMSNLHFINIEDWQSLEEVLDKTAGADFPTNVVEGIHFFSDILAGDSAKAKVFRDKLIEKEAGLHGYSHTEMALAYLIHFIGDLHQPMHAGRLYDRGGNLVAVRYFGSDTNLHSVWDRDIIGTQGLSYTEYASFLNTATETEVKEWQGHSVENWTQESVDLKSTIYPATYANTSGNPRLPDLGFNYNFAMKPIMDGRLRKGGIRLAGVLNKALK